MFTCGIRGTDSQIDAAVNLPGFSHVSQPFVQYPEAADPAVWALLRRRLYFRASNRTVAARQLTRCGVDAYDLDEGVFYSSLCGGKAVRV